MLLHTYLNFDKNKNSLDKYGYDIKNIDELKDLLEAELVNSYLFASNEFIVLLENFIKSPSESARITVAKEMRKDLWKLK